MTNFGGIRKKIMSHATALRRNETEILNSEVGMRKSEDRKVRRLEEDGGRIFEVGSRKTIVSHATTQRRNDAKK